MSLNVGLIYNEPIIDRYSQMGEADAIADVLEEVTAVEKALIEMGHSVNKIGLVPPIDECRRLVQEMPVDIYFNLFEGFAGRPETEAMMAGIMAVTGKPYTGSSPATLVLALDKAKTKELLIPAGVLTPRFHVFRQPDITAFHLNYPVIVKPAAEDASHGVSRDSVVRDDDALRRQIEKVCAGYGGTALVEEFIDGRELSATIMGNSKPIVLSISEIVYTLPPDLPRVLTFASKWTPGDIYFENTDPVCPAEVDKILWDHVAATSLKAYRLTGCRGYARVDMRVNDEGQAYVLEVNPNPDISLTSGAVRQAAAIGLSYPQFVDKIMKLAMEKNKVDCGIRAMLAADKPVIMDMLRDTPEFEPAEVPIAEEVLDCYLGSPGVDYQALVAERDNQVTGYICYGSTPLTESTWDIYWMAVLRPERGRGIGTALLREAERRMQTSGGHLLLIETSSKPNYLPTRRFYRRHGYKQISRIKDFYAPGDHLVTFEKRV